MPILRLALTLAIAVGVYAASGAGPGDAMYPIQVVLRKAFYLDREGPLSLAPSEASSRYLVGVATPRDQGFSR